MREHVSTFPKLRLFSKSDAEIPAAYEAWNKRKEVEQAEAMKRGQDIMRDMKKHEAETRAVSNQAMKDMTGKSMQDLSAMSDEELEAFAAEMEKKFGQ